MSQPSAPAFVIEARAVHKTSNALKLTFADGPGEPLAVGTQGTGDGKGKKFATLLGFKNGGTGTHSLTLNDGSSFVVESKDGKPSEFARSDGTGVATAHRGATTSIVSSGGGELLSVIPDPVEPKSPDLFRLRVVNPAGTEVAALDIIRKAPGWATTYQVLEGVTDYLYWMGHAGEALPIPILGARLIGRAPLSTVERDVLLCACVDIVIGLRPYVAEMN